MTTHACICVFTMMCCRKCLSTGFIVSMRTCMSALHELILSLNYFCMLQDVLMKFIYLGELVMQWSALHFLHFILSCHCR